MRGMMYVTSDLKSFLAKNPQQVTKLTEWKLSDRQRILNELVSNATSNVDNNCLLHCHVHSATR